MNVRVRSCRNPIFRVLALIALFSISGVSLHARLACPCVLTWEASTSTSTVGYAVYYGINGSSVTNRLDVGGSLSATMNSLTASTNYFFYVVAYDANGVESQPSDVLQYAPPAMTSLKLVQLAGGTMRVNFRAGIGTTCRVEFADSLSSPQWTLLNTATADANGQVAIDDPSAGQAAMRFYRGVLP